MLKHLIKAESYANKTAIIFNDFSYSYSKLLTVSRYVSANLLGGQSDLSEERVAFMVNPGFDYVATQWGIWQAGGVAVPLCVTHPLNSLEYVIIDTGAKIIIVDECYIKLLQQFAQDEGIKLYSTTSLQVAMKSSLPELNNSRKAMILYTSGTTNLPKGVVSTFANLEAQVDTLLEAWEWQDSDHTLCLLPLHHVHGIVNVVCCSLAAGAVCQFLDKFSPDSIFNIFKQQEVNVFMAVPTIYFKLIAFWDTLSQTEKESVSASMEHFRLMVSGSAALPVTVMDRWKMISGHVLLERYGMTEIGMAISNSYRGERLAGYVGKALPGVDVRLASDDNQVLNDEPGEIQIRGANVFPYYWQRPEETAKSFTEDGWFKTGDIAILENNNYKILGRNSTDIIKSGGYKISALEIEEVLRTHPEISDCAVVGIEDEEWGELVAAAIVAKLDTNTQEINTWIRERMASYKTPKRYIIVSELPRNTMGKVTKKDVKILF
jgi:malonyl-CoA/methylmalonyl-CoA synthetase